ncbi:hypothetical protein Lal_00039400 [Lupinus albus]|nr:hypothetical protein Lal_00039400 [Lupinus albus]
MFRTHPNLQHRYKDEQFLPFRKILTSTIDIVDQINEHVLTIIPDEFFQLSLKFYCVGYNRFIKTYMNSNSIDISDVNESETFNIVTLKFLN